VTDASLPDELARAEADATDRIAAASTLEELRAVESTHVGKKSTLATLNQRLGGLDVDARKEAGRSINEVRTRLQALVDARRDDLAASERAAQLDAERLDLTEVPPLRPRGHLTVTTQTRDALEDVFIGMGYAVAEGPEVETDFYNFEALNMPPAHPARSMWDTLYVKLGRPEQVMLRTHTSPVQIRVMQSRTPPIYTVMPGRCYRKETLDARHSPVFHQIEGLVVDKGITFGDLAGTIEAFTHAYFGPDKESRLRPSYFPFTEPSAEFEVTCVFCDGAGCGVCSRTGWIELGGCGMVDPNVFEAVGYDPERYTGFAFGFGLDRMAMTRYGVDHIKAFWDGDVRFLAQF
jgi:phenylalanyl-tRNA synthetase alpha chain